MLCASICSVFYSFTIWHINITSTQIVNPNRYTKYRKFLPGPPITYLFFQYLRLTTMAKIIAIPLFRLIPNLTIKIRTYGVLHIEDGVKT